MRHGGNVWDCGGPCRWPDFSANLRPECLPDLVVKTLHAAAADARYYPDQHMSAARRGLAAYLNLPEANDHPPERANIRRSVRLMHACAALAMLLLTLVSLCR